MSRWDRSFAAAQRAYDAMEAPCDETPLTPEEQAYEQVLAEERAEQRARAKRSWYAAFCDEDDIIF